MLTKFPSRSSASIGAVPGKDFSGAVIRGERSLYSIDARSGQRLSVSISAEEDNAVFQIYAPGARAERRDYGVEIVGPALPGAGKGEDADTWSGVLPDGDVSCGGWPYAGKCHLYVEGRPIEPVPGRRTGPAGKTRCARAKTG